MPSTAIRRTSIPGSLSQQVHGANSLIVQMIAMTDVKLEAQSQCPEAYQSEIMAAIIGRNDKDKSSILSQWNADPGHFHLVDVRSIGNKPYDDAAYSHRASDRSGTLVLYENNKSRDDHAEGLRLWPSEIGWQFYQMVAAEDTTSAKKLRAIVQYFVIEPETHMILYQAAQESSCTRSGPDSYQEYTEFDNGFYAILGTVLGRSTAHMLLDHKEELGYRIFERIIVFGKQNAGDYVYKQARSFVILLSTCRQRPTETAPSCPTALELVQKKIKNLMDMLHSE